MKVLGLLVLILGLLLAGAAFAAPVRALVFQGPDCAPCADLSEFYLPALTERYGRRLEVAGIDLSTPRGQAVYGAAARAYGLPEPWPKRPVALVGGQVLVGLAAIAKGLGDGFEVFAGHGESTRWPDLPGLREVLPAALGRTRTQARAAAADFARETAWAPLPAHRLGAQVAEGLAWLVLVGIVVALPLGLWWLRPRSRAPRILPTLAVFLVGLGVSAYTAYTSLAGVAPLCGPVGDCASVQASEYAHIFGIPMGGLGLIGYGLIAVAWVLSRRSGYLPGLWFAWGLALFGVAFSVRLTALEIFVIHATCIWCLASAVAMTLLYLLLAREVAAGRFKKMLI